MIIRSRQSGFSVAELLVVVGIIGLLMAGAIPAFISARESANRGSDTASMNSLRSALQQYYVDNGQYPPALLGYVSKYRATGAKEVVPADRVQLALFPRRVTSIETFRPYNLRLPEAVQLKSATNILSTMLVAARYPNRDPRAIGAAAQVDLKGTGSLEDSSDARQAFGPKDGYVNLDEDKIESLPQDPNDLKASKFFRISGYDVADSEINDDKPNLNGIRKRMELRYTRFWTTYALRMGGNKFDDPRQMGYADPPENTVVTWDSYFRVWQGPQDNRLPTADKKDIILFLGGSAKAFNSRILFERSWRVLPTDG